MNIHPMWKEFLEIQNHLSQCLKLIKEKTAIENKEIQEAIFELLDSGVKLVLILLEKVDTLDII